MANIFHSNTTFGDAHVVGRGGDGDGKAGWWLGRGRAWENEDGKESEDIGRAMKRRQKRYEYAN